MLEIFHNKQIKKRATRKIASTDQKSTKNTIRQLMKEEVEISNRKMKKKKSCLRRKIKNVNFFKDEVSFFTYHVVQAFKDE